MVAILKENFKGLLSFLRQPSDEVRGGQKASDKLRQMLSLLFIDMLLVLAVIWPVTAIIELTELVDMENHAVAKLLEEAPVWLVLLMTVVFAPVLEELIFRTFLIFKRNYPLRLVIAIAGVGGIRRKARVRSFFRRSWRKYYQVVFYFTAALFAVIHITNFEMTTAALLLMPFLVLPQFIIGVLLGYVRVRLGLIWSIYLHAAHNLVLVGISLWFMSETIEKINLKTEAYEIKIEEAGRRGRMSSSTSTGGNVVDFERVAMKDILLYLLEKEESLVEIKDPEMADLLLNISFINKVDTLNGKQLIMEQLQAVYGMKIYSDKKWMPYYDLMLTDSVRLQKHRSKTEEAGATIKSSKNSLQMENVEVKILVERLNKAIGFPVELSSSLGGLYNIRVTTSPIKDLQQHLLQEYGLTLVQKKKKFDFVTVEF